MWNTGETGDINTSFFYHRGLTDDEKLKQQQFQQQQQQQQQQQKLPAKQLPKVPAAIHMVKRKGSLPSTGAPLTSPGPPMGHKRRRAEPQLQPEVNPEQQPVEYGEYDETIYNEQGYEETEQPGGTAIQLTGLVCPHCRLVYHDVETLKDHIAGAHRMQQSAGKLSFKQETVWSGRSEFESKGWRTKHRPYCLCMFMAEARSCNNIVLNWKR